MKSNNYARSKTVNKQQIKDLALSNGFKLKQQPSGEMELNPYVYDFAEALLAAANKRVRELEQELDIAIECIEQSGVDYDEATEQLRKEQD